MLTAEFPNYLPTSCWTAIVMQGTNQKKWFKSIIKKSLWAPTRWPKSLRTLGTRLPAGSWHSLRLTSESGSGWVKVVIHVECWSFVRANLPSVLYYPTPIHLWCKQICVSKVELTLRWTIYRIQEFPSKLRRQIRLSFTTLFYFYFLFFILLLYISVSYLEVRWNASNFVPL